MYEGMYVGRQVGTHVCMFACVFALTGASSEYKAVGSYLNSIHEFPIQSLLKHEINIDYFRSRHAMNKKLQLYQSVEEHFTKILTRR
jgi:hypothetical protein